MAHPHSISFIIHPILDWPHGTYAYTFHIFHLPRIQMYCIVCRYLADSLRLGFLNRVFPALAKYTYSFWLSFLNQVFPVLAAYIHSLWSCFHIYIPLKISKIGHQNLKQAFKNWKLQKWVLLPTFLLKFQPLGWACKIPAPTHMILLSTCHCSNNIYKGYT